MGLGDFLKGAASGIGDVVGGVVANNPITQGVVGGANYLAEKYGEHAQQNVEASQRGRAGTVGIVSDPNFVRAQAIVNNPANTPFRIVGEQTEQYGEKKLDAAEGYYKFAKTAVTHPTEIWRGGKALVSAVKEDPTILGHIAMEAGVATALDPMTYMGGGAVTVAEITERFAARGGRRAITEVVEEGAKEVVKRGAREVVKEGATRSADDLAESMITKAAREAAPEGIEEAFKATARRQTRSGRVLEAIDQLPANLRESVTDRPVGRLGQKRIDIGERLMPGAQTSLPRAMLKDVIQSSPTLPTQGAGLGYRQSVWRAQQIGRRLSAPGKIHTATRVGQILNDPMKALTSPEAQGLAMQGAEWVVREHPEAVAAVGGLVAANQALGARNLFKALTGDGGGEESAAEPKSPPQPSFEQPTTPPTQSIGLMQFHADQTHATRTSRRRPGARAQLGTVVNTMPTTAIGPTDWYGRNAGYDAGRGFQQRDVIPSEPLRPLVQPTGMTSA